jgi:MoaA/NifB/PqqE/SkfB family radical SAM enzyme
MLFRKDKICSGQDFFCIFPFIEMDCFTDGAYRPCCRYNAKLQHQGKALLATKHTFIDAWNSDSLARLRQQLINNKKPRGCSYCVEQEALGIESFRMVANKGYGVAYALSKLDLIEKFQQGKLDLLRLHLRMSNKCNLKCRICSPKNSFLWQEEVTGKKNIMPFSYYTMTNMTALQKLLPTARYLNFIGGEPLVFDENISFIEAIINAGYSKQIEIEFTTNGTIFSEKICKLCLQFQAVRIQFSVDDLGERFNYQRKNAVFENVWENIKKYENYFENNPAVSFVINVTVSLFNIYYLPQLFEELYKCFPRIRVLLNILIQPKEMAIWNISDQVKKEIQKRLLAVPEHIQDYLKMQNSGGITDIIISMNSKSREILLISFLSVVRKRDLARKESFEKTFPEFYKLLKSASRWQ